MKLLIASDIHGSARYCKDLLQAFACEQADRLLLLGDILYHGPRNSLPDEYDPRAVIGMLNDVKDRIFCVRGNCDSEVDQMVLDFPLMADYAFLSVDGLNLYATHGHVFHPDRLPPLQPRDIFLFGHTHVPFWECRGENPCFNPGSVSIPKAGSSRGFMVLKNGLFLWKTLDGTVYHTFAFS